MAQAAEKMREEDCTGGAPTWTHGSFFWNELLVHDAERAKKFYADTLGWSFDPMPMQDGGTYWVAKAGGRMVGGVFTMTCPSMADMPENWMPYIAVDDVEKRSAKAVAAGAVLMRDLFDIPGIGRIALLREPGGAGVGWITPSRA